MDKRAKRTPGIIPFISVIIPNYNDIRIERAIKSVIKQKTNDYELIVVDGLSQVETVNSIYTQYKSYITELIIEKDRGIFDAINKGLKVASGKFIYLMGSDDFLEQDDIFSTVKSDYFDNKKLNGFCIGAKFINSKNKAIRLWHPTNVSANKIRWGLLPPHFSIFLSRQLYEKVGLFDLRYGNVGGDSYWLMKLSKYALNFKRIPGKYLIMSLGGTSTGSIKNIITANINVGRVSRQLGYGNWMVLPFKKMFSKIFQYRLPYEKQEL